MSASRDVIAKAYEVPEEDVICKNCEYMVRQFPGRVYCIYWGHDSRANSYCSFFSTKGKPDDD